MVFRVALLRRAAFPGGRTKEEDTTEAAAPRGGRAAEDVTFTAERGRGESPAFAGEVVCVCSGKGMGCAYTLLTREGARVMVVAAAAGAVVAAAFRFTSPGANRRVKTSVMVAVRDMPVLEAPLEGAVVAAAVVVVTADEVKMVGKGTLEGKAPPLAVAIKVAGTAVVGAAAPGAGATSAEGGADVGAAATAVGGGGSKLFCRRRDNAVGAITPLCLGTAAAVAAAAAAVAALMALESATEEGLGWWWWW